jgi:hypothetical protein
LANWLTKQYAILGIILFQNWMLLALALILIGVFVSWWVQR